MAKWRRVACWISKVTRSQAHACDRAPTHTHKHARTCTQKYVIVIAFRRQQWFRERAPVLRYTCITPVVT